MRTTLDIDDGLLTKAYKKFSGEGAHELDPADRAGAGIASAYASEAIQSTAASASGLCR